MKALASGERFHARGFQVFLLADVTDYGDDFAAVVFLQPGNNDGGVESSGVGEYHFLGLVQLLIHDSSLRYRRRQAGAQAAAAGAPRKKIPWEGETSIARSE